MIAFAYLSIVLVVGYLIGNINFARIFSFCFGKKDITTVGSKNPGTMNVLRTRGVGEAFLTLIFEAIKSGAPALACYFIFKHFFPGFENLAFFVSAFAGIVGHCWPVFYKFKGGKGVACTFGMFLFHPTLWWMSIVMFVICFVLFLFVEYPFLVTLLYVLVMTIYATCLFALQQWAWFIPLIVIVWANFFFVLFMHRGNIKRWLTGKENKINFRDKIFKRKETKTKESTVVEVQKINNVQSTSETEPQVGVVVEIEPTVEIAVELDKKTKKKTGSKKSK